MAQKKNDTLQIIQFDPDDFYITMVNLVLYNMGTELAGSAFDLETSKTLVDKITRKEIKPEIAIIEAHMGKSEYDGDKIAAKLKELVPEIKIIGFSTYETEKWSDIQAMKTLKDTDKSIIKALEGATGLTFENSNVKDPSD
ncbi:MAG: hypothetical protein US52_C0009G0003 [candidate division WS6 bacterium GW2011_GWA2_37_6]|uniref:Response regulatory domain-containing protein n=1 Tax=candidate division WS6 bacterium GW2011_GWA2_37_6 TaxID=1619087 RepID=A0A0G0K5Z9_9BACT|nr:MAG: hypothetical protein US52_C0009G0003 [candidate division WS6 bacterium GW2011_GWA2_37_6]